MSALLMMTLLAAAGTDRSMYCTGVDISGGRETTSSAILVFYPDEVRFRLRTKAFAATGRGSVSQAEYKGRLAAADGTVHDFRLDRYSGEIVVAAVTATGRQPEFKGTCRVARL